MPQSAVLFPTQPRGNVQAPPPPMHPPFRNGMLLRAYETRQQCQVGDNYIEGPVVTEAYLYRGTLCYEVAVVNKVTEGRRDRRVPVVAYVPHQIEGDWPWRLMPV